jgi:hypothetical protein
MRTPQACAGLLAVLALALAARADESWRKKPYTEWNEKEVREVLEKSPWAHRENLMLVKPSDQNAPCAAGNLRCFSDDSVSYPTAGPRRRPLTPDDIQSQQGHRAAAAMAPKPDGVFGTAVVRWESAQTVREALSRSGVKGEKVATAEAEPAPLPLSEAYIVYVDLRIKVSDVKKVPQSGVFTTAMAKSSILLVKSTGERISPIRVTSAPLPEFDDRKELALAAYYVYFPRAKDGKPVFDEKETLIRFECPLALQPIRSEFDLRDMRRGGNPDI